MSGNNLKRSLLLIAHTYAIDEHAKKLPALARYFDLTCVTVTKSSWGNHFGLDVKDAAQTKHESNQEHDLVELDAHGHVNSVTGFVLKGLQQVIASKKWDIILVENEPWSLLKWQTFIWTRLFCPKAMYGEFTWENILRPGFKGGILSMVYKMTARWADFWICGNQAAGRIVHDYGMPASAILISPQVGVDTSHYSPVSESEKNELRSKLNLPKDAIVVGFAGRLVHEKGVQELLSSVEKINARPEFQINPIHLAFMGHGPLKTQIDDHTKSKTWLHRFDPVPHHELPGFLQCLDILVLGSKRVVNSDICWEEQFGHILIEAMGCDTLTLGSYSGAIPEVIGDNALLFTPGSVDELIDLLLKYVEDKNALQTKKSFLNTRLQEKYTHEAIAKEWSEFLLTRLNVRS